MFVGVAQKERPCLILCFCRYYIVSGSLDNSVRVWDFASGNCTKELNGHTNDVTSVCVTPDNRYIVNGSDDKDYQSVEYCTLLFFVVVGRMGCCNLKVLCFFLCVCL